MSGGIFIFPWQRPFLPALKDFMDAPERRQLHTLLIVPHRRPWRYLQDIYAAAPENGRVLPKMLTMTEVFSEWRSTIPPMPLRVANMLDCVALLHGCIQSLTTQDEGLERSFAAMSMDRFFPWGVRLVGLFEELFGQCVDICDLPYAEEDVSAPAAALLGALGRIGAAYQAGLEERCWSTAGLDALLAARHAAEIPPLLRPSPDRSVIIAGFFQLTASEDAVVSSLLDQGADVCLHTDPALAAAAPAGDSLPCHWACREHARWLLHKRVLARLVQVPGDTTEPQWRFFTGYDVHSQIAAVPRRLTTRDDAQHGSTAIVLGDETMLMPLLHELPDKEVNVSMGYPLERTPLYQLLDSLLRLQERENTTEDGKCYWKALQAVLAHPYLGLLRPADAPEDWSLRPVLHSLDRQLRRGKQRFVIPKDLCSQITVGDELTHPLLQQIRERLIDAFTGIATTADMAEALDGVCALLLDCGDAIWKHYPLDAEALYRVMQHVLPVLRDNAMSTQPLTGGQLRSITREILVQERIPFEADPLSGVQILGMLETRLLHFEHVHILEATDDRLPGQAAPDVLLPDSLRKLLGLPDSRRRELVSAYNLYRLCASARKVTFYWQEGSMQSALFDGKKCRSRFVEQMIWNEEQRRGRLLEPGDALLDMASVTLQPGTSTEPAQLRRTPVLDAVMSRFLDESPLSPTQLDTYLECPLRFVWTHLCKLHDAETVNEGDDPAAVGSLLHAVLQTTFQAYKNKPLPVTPEEKKQLESALLSCFAEQVREKELHKTLPPDSMAMLLAAVPVRFHDFVEALPPDSILLAVEQPVKGSLILRSGEQRFCGVMDRLDRRAGKIHIIDYKTGSIPFTGMDFGEESDLLDRMVAQEDSDDANDADLLLGELREQLGSVQLPCYLALAREEGLTPLGNAAFVELRDSGKEYPLVGGAMDEEAMNKLVDSCVAVISFIVWHMRYAPAFTANRDSHCDYCPFKALC